MYSPSTTSSARSTTSGSTAQHGPRFKRYRLPTSGIKEVPDETNFVDDVNMINESRVSNLEVSSKITEEVNISSMDVGWAIMDSGATRTVCGKRCWDNIVEYLTMRDMMNSVVLDNETRDFRFGDGVVTRSIMAATIPVCVAKVWKTLTIHVLPGKTPLLLARPDLEDWNVEVNYGKQVIKVDDIIVKHARTSNGHYMIHLFDDLQDALNVDMLNEENEEEPTFMASMMTDDASDMEFDIPDVEMPMVENQVNIIQSRCKEFDRTLKFWEVYVDEGNLSTYMKNYDDVQVKTFKLPEWNFEEAEAQERFLDLMDVERPHHVMMAPECRLWSPMQNMNYKTPERKKLLEEMRAIEENRHLGFYE